MAAKPARDEVELRLEEKIDRLAGALAEVRELVAGKVAALESAVHQVKTGLTTQTLRLDATDKQVTDLVASKHRAEGALWAWRVGYAVIAALAGMVAHWLASSGGH